MCDSSSRNPLSAAPRGEPPAAAPESRTPSLPLSASSSPPPPRHRLRAGGSSRSVCAAGAPATLQWDFVETELGRTAWAWDAIVDSMLDMGLVILFCFFFFADCRVTDAFTFRQAIRVPLVTSRATASIANFKTAVAFHDISNAQQYTDYVLATLLPAMYDIHYPTGSAIPVGAVRMRTQRAVANRCNINLGAFQDQAGGSSGPFVSSLATAPSPVVSIIQRSCYGNLGGGGGSAMLGATSGSRRNEMTVPRSGANDSAGPQEDDGRGLWDRGSVASSAAETLWMLLGSRRVSGGPAGGGEGGADTSSSLSADDDETGPMWRYRTCEELCGPGRPTSAVVGALGHYHCGGFFFDTPFWRQAGNGTGTGTGMNDPTLVALPFYSPDWERVALQSARARVRRRFLDSGSTFVDNVATRFAVAEFYLYQPSTHLFASVKLSAEAVSGGAWVPRSEVNVFGVWTAADTGRAAYAIVFFALLLLAKVRLLFSGLGRHNIRGSKSAVAAVLLWSFWQWLDAAAVLLLLVSGSLRIVYLARCAQLRINLPSLVYASEFPTPLDSLVTLYQSQKYVTAVAGILLTGRLTMYSAVFFTPLTFMTRVFAAGRSALIGTALLFMLCVTVYAVTGHVLFRDSVAEFSTMDQSFRLIFYAFFRQVDIRAVLVQAPRQTEAVFFFWSYILLSGITILPAATGVLSASFAAVGADAKLSVGFASATGEGRARRRLRDAIMPPVVRWIVFRHYIRTLLRPRRWPVVVSHWWRGRSRSALLHRALRALRAYRRLRHPARRTLQEADRETITEDEFMHAALFYWSGGPDNAVDRGGGGDAARKGSPLAGGSSTSSYSSASTNPLASLSSDAKAAGHSLGLTPGALADAKDPYVLYFYDEVWGQLRIEWAATLTSKEAAETERRAAWATAAVAQVAGARMDLLQRLPGRLASLEASVTQLTALLAELPATV